MNVLTENILTGSEEIQKQHVLFQCCAVKIFNIIQYPNKVYFVIFCRRKKIKILSLK